MQASPIAATVGGVPAIIGGGKMGDVYAMNAQTGALLWKTPVGEHNGHDDDSLLLLEHKITLKPPYVIAPGSYRRHPGQHGAGGRHRLRGDH